MSVDYQPVLWNAQKRKYNRALWLGIGLYFLAFTGATFIFHPLITIETLIIRMTATAAFVLLHLILMIGPLSRINRRFLPLLYNRRHMGVSMFFLALIHAIFSLIQFHTLGDTPALVSLFLSNPNYHLLGGFPFQVLGFFALLILFLMASTSHDFWLKNLSPAVWKALHMGVYLAYALLVAHVLLGVLQLERDPLSLIWLGAGVATVCTLHLISGEKAQPATELSENLVQVGHFSEIPENRAKIIQWGKEEIAIFRYEGKLSAVRNECKHQHGPLGEGKIVDGCITCPWHGYQYLPESGASPPPFEEKVSTYSVQINDQGIVWVDPQPLPEGTSVPPAILPKTSDHG